MAIRQIFDPILQFTACYAKGLEAAQACETAAAKTLKDKIDRIMQQFKDNWDAIIATQKECNRINCCEFPCLVVGQPQSVACAACKQAGDAGIANQQDWRRDQLFLAQAEYGDMIRDDFQDGTLFGNNPEIDSTGTGHFRSKCVCCLRAYAAYNACFGGGGKLPSTKPVPDPVNPSGVSL